MPLASDVPAGFLTPSYSAWAVAASFLVATLASFVAINLSLRVRSTRGMASAAWWLAGALVMGTGIWSMHFVGMQAFQLSIPLGYRGGLTLLSWTAAVAASGVALGLASHGGYRRAHLALGALAMGGGIGAMHYLGMAAIDLTVGIVWNGWLVAASLMVAVAASASALFIFQAMHRMPRAQRPRYQAAAALVMGAAICGMHYTGMAAAHFPAGAVCLSAKELGGPGLTALVLMASGMLLVSTLFTAILDARLQQTALQLTRSLQESNAKLQHANAELQQRAYADALTGLPNRLLFEDRLNHALLRLERANHHRVEDRLAVLFIDLDGFKPVNDSFGHAAGDVILVEAADRLRAQARECDTIARVGGDEFLLLLEDISSTADAIAIARRVLETLTRPFSIEGKDVEISCSIGVVVHPDHGERDKLVAHADAAMYAAKRAGGNGYVLFEPHMGSEAADQLGLQSDLRHALERGQLALHYQPKIDSTRGCISGVEALLRWHHPTRGMVSPTVFIALAERFGLINRLGNWVIDEACRQIAEWRASGVRMRVAINLSVHQLRGGARPAAVRDHRVRGHGGHQGHPAHVRRAGAHRRLPVHRRLRHRLLQPQLPAPAARAAAQDRPQLRLRHRAQAGRTRRGRRRRAAGPRPGPARGGRRRGNRGPAQHPDGHGLRRAAGLLLRPPAARRHAARVDARQRARRHRHRRLRAFADGRVSLPGLARDQGR
jgi:diguanylate cyclase (GGDEF)-like protein